MLEAHHHAPLPGVPGSEDPRGHKSHPPTPTLAIPTPTPSLRGFRGYKHTRAALFPMPNFSLKNFSVPSQYDGGSPGS